MIPFSMMSYNHMLVIYMFRGTQLWFLFSFLSKGVSAYITLITSSIMTCYIAMSDNFDLLYPLLSNDHKPHSLYKIIQICHLPSNILQFAILQFLAVYLQMMSYVILY